MHRRHAITTALALAGLLLTAAPAQAQAYAGPVRPDGTPVDRNVADTSANAASQRVVETGNGQFGVNSLLLDRHAGKPFEPPRNDLYTGDNRINQRYLLQMPGVTAVMRQTDYIGLSPEGQPVRNQQTRDGAEILTYGPDTVFVLSPDLLRGPTTEPATESHPNQLQAQPYQPTPLIDPRGIMHGQRVTGKEPLFNPRTIPHDPRVAEQLRNNPNYVHPEIIERRKRLKAEREQEEAEQREKDAQRDAEKEDAQREAEQDT